MLEKNISASMYRGVLRLGETEVECHVLTDETRVITSRAVVRLISGRESGGLAQYLSKIPLNNRMLEVGAIHFHTQGGTAHGYRAEDIIDIASAYVDAWDAGLLRADQTHIARRCFSFLRAAGKVGLVALIDEATGYQQQRKLNALEVKVNAYILEDLRPWEEPRFLEQFWRELFRLHEMPYHPQNRPSEFGKFILNYI
jgi:hypothetical protein